MIDYFRVGMALLGGGMIGLSAGLMVWLLGRIAGISGMVSGVVNRSSDWWLRLSFLVGLLSSSYLYQMTGVGLVSDWQNPPPVWLLIVAGLLVGIGTRLGSGCTSGHGVCGLARLSPRSLVATLSFMLSGMVIVGLVRYFGG